MIIIICSESSNYTFMLRLFRILTFMQKIVFAENVFFTLFVIWLHWPVMQMRRQDHNCVIQLWFA